MTFAQSVDPMFLTSETCTWAPLPGTTPAMMRTNGVAIVAASTFTECTGFNGSVSTHLGPTVKCPYSWEYTVQQEIMPQFVVSVGYYYRQNRNNLGIANWLVPSSDYTPYTITNPLNGSPLTIYNELPSLRGQIYNVYDNYKQLNSDYNGTEFQARKQFHRNNAFVMAAFTIGRLSGRTTSGDLNNPNVLANAVGEVGGGHLSASPQRRVHPARSCQSIRKLSVSDRSAIHAVLHREHEDRSGIDPADTSLNLVKPGSERLPI